MKYALIIRVGSIDGGKYYNDYRDGNIMLFDDFEKAEKFALKLEEGSSKRVWVEVVQYNCNLKLPNLIESDFIYTFDNKLGKSYE